MASLLALMGSIAVALPSVAAQSAVAQVAEPVLISAAASGVQQSAEETVVSEPSAEWTDIIVALAESHQIQTGFQLRFQQRVVIRVPSSSLQGNGNVLDDLPDTPLARHYTERRMGNCIAMSGIAGVQVSRDDRLIMFMRDRRIISAELERSCRARDFYSGFYVERSSDGQLCVDRDELHARSGAKCEVDRLRQLVEDD